MDEAWAARVEVWAREVLQQAQIPPFVTITLWRASRELEDFYRKEKEQLGIVSDDEGFLATHEAWRGYPRIHLCQERLDGVPPEVARGAIQHELAHAALHGSREFYTFRFTRELQDAAAGCGMDFAMLRQCVYFLSIAVKDGDATQWLAQVGLGSGQRALLDFLLSETDDERRTWEAVSGQRPLRKIALAAFLKTLLPAVVAAGPGEPPGRPATAHVARRVPLAPPAGAGGPRPIGTERRARASGAVPDPDGADFPPACGRPSPLTLPAVSAKWRRPCLRAESPA